MQGVGEHDHRRVAGHVALAARHHGLALRLVVAFTLLGSPGCARPGGTTLPASGAQADPTLVTATAIEHGVAVDVAPLTFTALNTGQGDCALLQCPNGANILIDCGSTAANNSNTSREAIRARLDELIGTDGSIDVLVVTHPDRDHYNWIEAVVGSHPVRRAVHSLSLDRYGVGEFNTWLTEHVPDIRTLPADYHQEGPLDLFDCGAASIRVLAANVAPTGSHAADAGWISNSSSVVLKIDYTANGSTFSLLTGGDATTATEESIMAAYDETSLDVTVLRLAHHGTDVTSTSDRWLAATSTEYAFSSAGHFGGNLRHPRCVVLNRALTSGSLEGDDCHQLVCGVGSEGDGAGGRLAGSTCDPETGWCTGNVDLAVFDTYSNGEVSFSFDGELTLQVGVRTCG